MAEEAQDAAAAVDTGGLALDLAMEEARGNPGLHGHVAAFLDDQRRLIADQRHHLHLGAWEKRIGVALRAATLVVGIAFASALSLMVWDAAHANGLIVDEFTVPSELVGRGLTGQAVAGQLLSDLLSLQARSNSVRAASSYANNWGNNLKVEILETGISIGELSRFLREWLGHETHVSGAVVRTATGIAVRASAGSDAFPSVADEETDLDGLVQKMAEAIYSRTQPYRYAIYVYSSGRLDEGEAALKLLVANGAPEDRYWANNGLISVYNTKNRWDDATQAAHAALALRPGAFVPNFFLARTNDAAQRDEDTLAAAQATMAGARDPDIGEQGRTIMRLAVECIAARMQGDFQGSMALCDRARQLPDAVSTRQFAVRANLRNAANLHDRAAMNAVLADIKTLGNPADLAGFARFAAWNELNLGHWSPALIRQAAELGQQTLLTVPTLRSELIFNPRIILPPIAHATALSGDFKGAHAIIDSTWTDCSLCLRVRGRIAALEKNWGAAEYWFARAATDAPSTPFPFTEWGRMLLDKGDPDAAIAQLTIAHEKGPKFADPLVYWGEALMAQNQSHLALKKFTEAEKYAPNWGRLHLKWGQALTYAGKPAEARAHFARAAALDLTPSERTDLARHL